MMDWWNWSASIVCAVNSTFCERDANFWAALGQMLSAAAALITFPLILHEVKSSSNSQMADHILRYQKESAGIVNNLFESKEDESKWKSIFHDYANFLEAYCGLINAGVFGGKGRDLIRDDIVNSIATIESNSYMKSEMNRLVDTETTFNEMTIFIRKNRKRINTIAARRSK